MDTYYIDGKLTKEKDAPLPVKNIIISNKGILPVIKVNDRVVTSGRPGERTRNLMKLFHEYTDVSGQGIVS